MTSLNPIAYNFSRYLSKESVIKLLNSDKFVIYSSSWNKSLSISNLFLHSLDILNLFAPFVTSLTSIFLLSIANLQLSVSKCSLPVFFFSSNQAFCCLCDPMVNACATPNPKALSRNICFANGHNSANPTRCITHFCVRPYFNAILS